MDTVQLLEFQLEMEEMRHSVIIESVILNEAGKFKDRWNKFIEFIMNKLKDFKMIIASKFNIPVTIECPDLNTLVKEFGKFSSMISIDLRFSSMMKGGDSDSIVDRVRRKGNDDRLDEIESNLESFKENISKLSSEKHKTKISSREVISLVDILSDTGKKLQGNMKEILNKEEELRQSKEGRKVLTLINKTIEVMNNQMSIIVNILRSVSNEMKIKPTKQDK